MIKIFILLYGQALKRIGRSFTDLEHGEHYDERYSSKAGWLELSEGIKIAAMVLGIDCFESMAFGGTNPEAQSIDYLPTKMMFKIFRQADCL
jgi:hypothetical protein